jgi:F5/8 type C domain
MDHVVSSNYRRGTVSFDPGAERPVNTAELSNLGAVAVLAYASFVFLLTYWTDPVRPRALFWNGWYEVWYDQSQYFDMVQGLTHGNLGHFQYPSGYPLLAWCTWFIKSDPFLIADLLLFVSFVFFSFELFKEFVTPALGLAATVLLIHCSVGVFETPWSSTLSAAALACILWILVRRPRSIGISLLIGLCLGACFAARVGDVAIGFALLVGAFVTSGDRMRELGYSAVSVLTCVAASGVVIAINHHLSGSAMGGYLTAVRQGGFNPTALPWKLYGFVLDPFLLAGESNPLAKPLVAVVPALLLSPPGWLALRKSRPTTFWLFATCVAGWLCVYGGYVALSGFTLKYGSVHYAKVLFPLLIGTALYLVQQIADGAVRWRWLAVYGSIVLVAATLPREAVHRISHAEFTVRANVNHAEVSKAADGIDGTRWDSGHPQQPGMAFDIDLRKPRFVYRLIADTHDSPDRYGRDVAVYCSSDGVKWTKLAVVNNGLFPAIPEYRFEPVRARYFRLELTQPSSESWSIHEIGVYGIF